MIKVYIDDEETTLLNILWSEVKWIYGNLKMNRDSLKAWLGIVVNISDSQPIKIYKLDVYIFRDHNFNISVWVVYTGNEFLAYSEIVIN